MPSSCLYPLVLSFKANGCKNVLSAGKWWCLFENLLIVKMNQSYQDGSDHKHGTFGLYRSEGG